MSRKHYKLYVDGGGTTTVENYFSWKLFYSSNREITTASNLLQKTNDILVLPDGCSVSRPDGTGSNNIAEIMALYYGIKGAKESILYGHKDYPLYIYHDSQICYRWVMTALGKQDILRHQNILHANVRKEWIKRWVDEVIKLWTPNIVYNHVKRDVIVKVLGH